MRILFVMPHYFRTNREDLTSLSPDGRQHASTSARAESRLAAFKSSVMSVHQLFGKSQGIIRHSDRRAVAANESMCGEVHVVVMTTRNEHLLDLAGFSQEICYHVSSEDDPQHLGFACHRFLRDRWGNYDYYGYLEDDLALHDPWFFEKLRWFTSYVGQDSVLVPNRFERSINLAYKKCYIDGDLADRVSEPFQNIKIKPQLQGTVLGKAIRFIRPLNPHAGCFFLNAEQMQTWMRQPEFGKPTSAFVGPLESAATLGIMRTFRVYKPAPENASFLEIEHAENRFLQLVRKT